MRIDSLLSVLDRNQIDYQFSGDKSVEINRVAGLDNASQDSLSFLNSNKFIDSLNQTLAGVVVLRSEFQAQCPTNSISVHDPYFVYSLLAQVVYPDAAPFSGVAESASVALTADLEEQVCIEDQVVVKENVSIGCQTWVQSGAVIHRNVKIGAHCKIGSNVVIHENCIIGDHTRIESGAIIGGDGFGWAPNRGQWSKIPQVGRVVIGNHVSIGNNSCVDRGAIEDTVIEDHCIIDNLVHIAHNVVIGEGSAIAGQAGFAGTTKIGKHNIVAGQAGFAGHLSTADNCHFAAKSGVTQTVKNSGAYSGFPVQETAKWQKQIVRQRNLDKMAMQIKELQKQLKELQNNN
ncbi:UDP-3-O-(3-hydroxymyristoyl)glucosamine N-acyltransferase [Thiomicrorhabdus xiamenensis]|uniref:UDP-3-O-acylglucosamine N-acyltransferase n=1 Tax=Thiomicrorhabdus xiamenensis TaxID=2739063 RepID=A0A7D4NQJ1_9GAMM|nr:UDP-3-O-(3-hydroxymyristoyl)glucosamine N-acyltransferase [Thiomicrorhabdus xiamenensis]QKI89231.1 UDP-3-O-(3-hydroxymyristoyl)glucosamine N-acyltransferase [Thiomicrorhabdus xiamenensis]